MATIYTPAELRDSGIPLKDNLNAGSTYTFTVTNKELDGDAYLFFETTPHNITLPYYTSDSLITVIDNCDEAIVENYKLGVVIYKRGVSSFEWIPNVDVIGANVYIKATGNIGVSMTGGIVQENLTLWIEGNSEDVNVRVVDSSTQNNKGDLYSGKSLSLDGVNDYIEIESPITQINSTYSMIAKFDATHASTLYGGSSTLSVMFCATTSNYIHIQNNNGEYIRLTYDWELDTYYNIVVTISGTTVSLYVNGQFIDSDDFPAEETLTFDLIGHRPGYQYTNGEISNIKIFNTELSAAQILELYELPEQILPTGTTSSDLELYLPCTEGTGQMALDGSGNENHGTIYGTTWNTGLGSPNLQTALCSWNNYLRLKDANNVTLSTPIVPASSFTLELTYTVLGDTGTASVFSIVGGGTYIRYPGTGNNLLLYIAGTDGFYNNVVTAPRNQVNKLKIVYDSDLEWLYIYVNDVLLVNQSLNLGTFVGSFQRFGKYASIGEDDEVVVFRTKYWSDATQTNLVGDWDGITFQDKVGSNHGTVNGTPPYYYLIEGLTEGSDLMEFNEIFNPRLGGEFNFDITSYCFFTDVSELSDTSKLTIEAWTQNNGDTAGSRIVNLYPDFVEANKGYFLGIDGVANRYRISVYNGLGGSKDLLVSGVATGRMMLTGVFDGDASTLKLYRNGTLIGSTTTPTVARINTTTGPLELASVYNGINFFDKPIKIGKLKIYRGKALTEEEIQQNFEIDRNKFGI